MAFGSRLEERVLSRLTPGAAIQSKPGPSVELAPLWAVLARKKPALPDADQWDGVPDKLPMLEREPR